jgi:hypothetical protein
MIFPRTACVVFLALCSGAGCGTITLTAREQPERREPVLAAPSAPPNAGTGRIYIDIVDGPTRVDRIEAGAPELVCITPCWVDLPRGHHDLRFILSSDPSKVDLDVVKVFDQPVVYRRALGHTDIKGSDKTIGVVGVGVGASLVLGGGLTALGGGETTGLSNGFMITGALLSAVGVYFLYRGRTVQQDGTWTTWPVGEN